MSSQPRLRFAFLLPALLTVCGVIAMLVRPPVLVSASHAVFDQFQRWQPRTYQESPVRIVDIDEASLAQLGQWPWPRDRLAVLVDRLRAAGAAAIVFDVAFLEPDRTSPSALARVWPLDESGRQLLAALPDPDQVFAEALAGGGVVLAFPLDTVPTPKATSEGPARFVVAGPPTLAALPDFPGLVPVLPDLAGRAAGLGAMTFRPDADGVLRRVPLVLSLDGQPVPGLAAEALRVAQGARNYVLRTDPAGLMAVRIGALEIPTTPAGEVWLHYSPPVTGRSLSAWRVMRGELDHEVRGRIVLVGSSAQGLMDLRFSPLGGVIPGVEVHAQAIEQSLAGQGLHRPAWVEALELAILVVGGLGVGAAALSLGALPASGVAFAMLASLAAGTWLAFSNARLLIDALLPGAVVLASFVAAGVLRHWLSERRQRWVKQAFSRYVSPNLVQHLVDHPETLELGGVRRECSFVFTDLADFTRMLEGLDPAEAVARLNRYLDEMIAIAFRHQGTLDRIVGDAVAIMFSAPVVQPDHARRALLCALDMARFSRRYADNLNAAGIEFGQTRIGVHGGEVIVGNFGGSAIFDYRALGDPVNTASRLESANKWLGTSVCVSEVIRSAVPDLPARPVGRLILKGKQTPIMVYEPLPDAGEEDVDYAAAYAALRDSHPDALARFQSLAAQRPTDTLVAMHLARLEAGESGDLIVLREK